MPNFDAGFFREPNGDYLYIDGEMYYNKKPLYGARASAIEGVAASVQTTGVSHSFLETCRRVEKSDVPAEWLYNIGYPEDEIEGGEV